MPDSKQNAPRPTEQADSEKRSQDPGQPAQDQQNEQEADIGSYMSNLGAGTGVDIGPGAAGEMGGAAQEPDQPGTRGKTETRDQAEYPDSGDLPHLNQ